MMMQTGRLPVRKSTEWPVTVESPENSNDPKWLEQTSVELRLRTKVRDQASPVPTTFSMHSCLDWETMAKQTKSSQNQWENMLI